MASLTKLDDQSVQPTRGYDAVPISFPQELMVFLREDKAESVGVDTRFLLMTGDCRVAARREQRTYAIPGFAFLWM